MMRYAVFVDAGYLYAQGSEALFGHTRARVEVELNPPEVISKLTEVSTTKVDGASLLRIYWYDGLLQGVLSADQQKLADTENVKLRLGTVNLAGQQKGVDSLIVTDLVELARNHAIADAVLLSGDEDLRIGVQLAQSFGVRVHLIGVEPSRGSQSLLLLQEADTTTELGQGDIIGFLSLKSELNTIAGALAVSPETGLGNDVAARLQRAVNEFTSPLRPEEIITIAGARRNTRVPWVYDKRLLAIGRANMGRDLTDNEKFQMRNMFREAVRLRAANLPPG